MAVNVSIDALSSLDFADFAQEQTAATGIAPKAVSYTHLRAHETVLDLVCRLLLEKKNHRLTTNACNDTYA